jgi:hypothetical protein
MQVIIYTNENGNVSVCYPSDESAINEVKAKDTPEHSIIVDSSTLPTGSDDAFFDAWELNGSTITVNIQKAKAIKLNQYNANALQVAQKRQLNTLAGIANTIDDATWQESLTAGRASIESATTTAELVAIANPTGA